MFRFFILSLLCVVGYAATPFVNISGTSSAITVSSNIANRTYVNAGIKLNPGFQFSNSSQCQMNSRGYCVFPLNYATPTTLSITGSGNTLSGIFCLNANGPVSCQTINYTFGGPTLTDYVYVTNGVSGGGVSLCRGDSLGNLSDCQSNPATELSGLTPQSITIDTTNDAYAYISYSNGSNGEIVACEINPSTKALTGCTTADTISGVQTQQVSFLNLGSNGK